MTQLSKNFTLEELVKSDTAKKLGISNEPSRDKIEALKELSETILQKIRDNFGSPIIVTSGYRCPALNIAVGGAINSQHMYGEAADIKAKNGKNAELFRLIERMMKTGEITCGQLIWEKGNAKKPKWIHISLEGRHKNQLLYNY